MKYSLAVALLLGVDARRSGGTRAGATATATTYADVARAEADAEANWEANGATINQGMDDAIARAEERVPESF
jgi:hypothetical protein